MSGELRSGEFIRVEALADRLDMSATPVREALLSLRVEGFLQLKPNRGFVVSPLSVDDIRDLFEAQAVLAGQLAARAASRVSVADLAALAGVQATIERAAEYGELELLAELNLRFHQLLNQVAAAPRITWLMGTAARCVPHRMYATIEGWPDSTVNDHRQVMIALQAGSPTKARKAMVDHIVNAGELLAAHFEQTVASRSGVASAAAPVSPAVGGTDPINQDSAIATASISTKKVGRARAATVTADRAGNVSPKTLR
jgi:DNA-binding GntR family transcriptional regulator